MKFKVGDEVLVTGGKDKGRRGKIEEALPRLGSVRVADINVYKKHRKRIAGEKGGIIEFTRPLPLGNIALICPKCGKPTRVNFRVDKGGVKERICANCHRAIDSKTARK